MVQRVAARGKMSNLRGLPEGVEDLRVAIFPVASARWAIASVTPILFC